MVTLPALARADELQDLHRSPEDSAREENLRAQRARYEQGLKDYQPVSAKRVSQLFSLHVDKRQITLTPLIPPTPNFVNRKATLDGFNSPVMVAYCQWFDNQPEMRQFEFTYEDFPDPLTNGNMRIVWQPNGGSTADFQLANAVQGPSDHYLRVTYSQNNNRVLFIVIGNDGSNPQQESESINLTERDFVTLRQRHPAEVEKWLRPIFRRLQQDSLFAADSNAAWQALGEYWPVSAATMNAVRQLTPDLASTDWRLRRRAADEMTKLGRDGASAILRLDRKQLSVEQNARLDEVLSRFSPLPARELALMQNDPNFLLDCEYSDDRTVRRLAADRLQEVTGRPINIPLDAPEIARTDMIEKARLLLATH